MSVAHDAMSWWMR